MSKHQTRNRTARKLGDGLRDRQRRQLQAQLEQLQKKRQQRRRRTWGISVAMVIVIVVVAAVIALTLGGTKHSGPSASTTAGAESQPAHTVSLSTAQPPWPLPANALPYIAAAGLRAQGKEMLAVHYHAHVDIIDEGVAVPVPAYIGYVLAHGQATGITSLHTHDASGIVHIESATDTSFTLGQMFTEWGVQLTTGQVGGLATAHGNELRVFVNGSAFTGNPATIVLRPHQEIALWYGSASATPHVPSGHAFPSGD